MRHVPNSFLVEPAHASGRGPMFARNLWYAAAWSEDVSRTPLGRTIAGDAIVLYRDAMGEVVALSDTCPHRFAPIHRGKLVGDTIECGYHGLRFDSSGACVFNPHGNGVTPKAARLRNYPVIERDTLLWIWMGDPEAAKPSTIPDFPWLNDKSYCFTRAQTMFMPLACDLIADNLLDLSHAAYLHPTTLGAAAGTKDVTSVEVDGIRVQSDRMIPNSPPAFVFTATGAVSGDEHVDYWANMRWEPPASFYLDAGIVETGGRREDGRVLSSVQIVTPETEGSSFYLWKMWRNYRMDDDAITRAIEAAVVQAFTLEDEPMISAVQRRMGSRDFWSMKPVLLSQDAAAVHARRIMDQLVQREREDTWNAAE